MSLIYQHLFLKGLWKNLWIMWITPKWNRISVGYGYNYVNENGILQVLSEKTFVFFVNPL